MTRGTIALSHGNPRISCFPGISVKENPETKVDPLRFRLIRIANPGRQRVYFCTLSLRSFALCCYRTRKISADPGDDVGKVYNDYRPTWIGESYYFEAWPRAAGRSGTEFR